MSGLVIGEAMSGFAIGEALSVPRNPAGLLLEYATPQSWSTDPGVYPLYCICQAAHPLGSV